METNSQTQVVTTKDLFNRDDVKKKFQDMLGKRASSFITSVLQIISQNSLLAKADPTSVYHAAAVAATLDLPLNNNLGFAYIVPYNQKFQAPDGSWQTKSVAQFQMGYKGFIQLAQRTGLFKTIAASPIYEGQLTEQNPLTGFVFDFTKKASEKVVGYAAYFQLLNGFEKTLFMTTEQLQKHGLKYSKSFENKNGLWKNDFEAMAIKTVIKLLLSRFAPLSIEMQKAVITDQGLIHDIDGVDVTYPDNEEPLMLDKESERVALLIQDAKTLEDLEKIAPHVKEAQLDLYTVKKDELTSKQ